ncbi:MAG: SpoIIE family protein phosphatase [Saprospirales bacterium]|nr:SpoIIE family protein phosphatase [Saprospirales bacterium]
MPGGTLIGILDQAKFPVTELQLEPGDSLLLYTDGIPEATNSGDIMFDVARTQYLLNKEGDGCMNVLVSSLNVAVEAFVNKAPQHDDYTLFALRYHGN